MNERIHQHLDGGGGPGLSAEERARADALARTLDAAAAHLRAAPAPDLSVRVMAALPQGRPARSPWRTAAGWLWSPRPVRLTFRPAYALAGAAFAALAGIFVVPDAGRQDGAPAAVTAPAAQTSAALVYVQFRLEAPSARQVALAGTFTGWQPTLELRQTEPGVWSALVPLQPGVHDYVFVVDGSRWVPDPHAPQVDDSFGGTNSRIALPPPGASA
ncbi:MAG TPA: glycogen-binding domain-containing protein [Longimicrobium sp.]|jgi:hypothetical protein|uniref:glycogen-binding domain-containing protein n=1 Tax=Longimicrobium sp. TaxID=2029185 RepID=UPI002EDA08F4